MPKTILLIDDDPDILITTSAVLKKRDFNVLEAKTAEEALDVLKVQRPDLILTDVLLPQMNGYELVKQVKANSFTSDIPILVITGRGQMKEAFDVVGVAGFIPKPFSPDELIQQVHEILSIQEGAAAIDEDQKKRILVVGRPDQQSVLDDICGIAQQLQCASACTVSVPDAVAKTIEFVPDAFIVDVQLEGKTSAELVNIIRHLPNHEEKPIIGFCYYKVESLSDVSSREKILRIQQDADKFLANGADVFVDRYIREAMIETIKEQILSHGKKVT